jgi:hypothetical protein
MDARPSRSAGMARASDTSGERPKLPMRAPFGLRARLTVSPRVWPRPRKSRSITSATAVQCRRGDLVCVRGCHRECPMRGICHSFVHFLPSQSSTTMVRFCRSGSATGASVAATSNS